ncbi:hypothetical protein DFH07DRAFT_763532 [Mycena maculata]|uniref:ER transporter 6TM N-terminal domain-containing protein n=1 Tax=Mycena maculata TaxID=230809 RepID=A0AAD7P268_9AGAR|nr:hypothetical protein DFH07DRAFT_763532 [Mycena maculata]
MCETRARHTRQMDTLEAEAMPTLEAKTSPNSHSTLDPHPEKLTQTPDVHAAKRSMLAFLPLWVSGPLSSSAAWKVLLRCWLACFVSFVILLPNASLRTMGAQGFFALLTSLFLPPYLPVQLTIFLLSTLMLGLLGGWGIGLGAMRAVIAVRDQAHILNVTAQIQARTSLSSMDCSSTCEGCAEDSATAVYGGFLIIGALISGLIRAYAPKLLFMSIFGTIGPFCARVPPSVFTHHLGGGPAVPCEAVHPAELDRDLHRALYGHRDNHDDICVPQTMSHAMMDNLAEQLQRLQTMVERQDDVLAARPEDLTPEAPIIAQLKALRILAITTQQQLSATSGLISLEFSWGKWNGDDVRSLEAPTVALITRIHCLLNFDTLAGSARLGPPSAATDPGASTASLADTRWHETYLLRSIHTRNATLEAAHGVRPDDVLPLLCTATGERRATTVGALAAVRAQIAHVNRTRWRRDAAGDIARTSAVDAASVRLEDAIRDFTARGRMELLAPFLPLLEVAAKEGQGTGDGTPALPLRCYVFAANIVAVAEAAQAFVGRAGHWVEALEGEIVGAHGRTVAVETRHCARGQVGRRVWGGHEPSGEDDDALRGERLSRSPTNAFQKLMHLIHHFYLWTKTAEAIFTFKYVFISGALWLRVKLRIIQSCVRTPAVIRSSACTPSSSLYLFRLTETGIDFYYVEKGIWALIMAQTTINIYAADQIFKYTPSISTLSSTLVGLAIGLVACYVTRLAGTLVGLAIGLVAWRRHQQRKSVRFCCGAWRVRPIVFLRVFAPERYFAGNVLCCATFALVVCPWLLFKPESSSNPDLNKVGYSWIDGHAVQFASPGALLHSRLYRLVGRVAPLDTSPRAPPRPSSYDVPAKSGRKAVRRRNAASIASLANVYGFLLSAWIRTMGSKAGTKEAASTRRRGRLGYSLGYLEKEGRGKFLHSSKVLNPNFIADVMAIFSLISQSLRTGEPMHQVLPTSLLDRLFYQQSVDELHVLAKDLCGEIPMTGFTGWRDEYERVHLAAV